MMNLKKQVKLKSLKLNPESFILEKIEELDGIMVFMYLEQTYSNIIMV